MVNLGVINSKQYISCLFRSYGLDNKVVDLMEARYTDTCSCVNVDGVMSDCFAVDSGVRQGCRIAPDLFLGPMDYVMERSSILVPSPSP